MLELMGVLFVSRAEGSGGNSHTAVANEALALGGRELELRTLHT